MDIVERCSNYLSSGGLFNPEFADHDAVRDLVINCRDEIERLREALQLGADMRNAQKTYFKDRNQGNLIKSKQTEKAFDDALKDKE